MSELKQQKSKLRKDVLTKRSQFSEQKWRNSSEAIIESLKNKEFIDHADNIHVYVSMNDRNEVSTDRLIDDILTTDKKLIVPVTNFDDGTLSHSLLTSKEELKVNNWGIKEPSKVHPFDISRLDLIIVPMAAADRNGNRLGYGKGFYDRFLKQTNALKVGLVFSDFVYETIPTEAFDVQLDVIISDREVIIT